MYAESRVSAVVGRQEKGLPGVSGNKKGDAGNCSVKINIDHLLRLTDAQKNAEKRRKTRKWSDSEHDAT